MLKKIMLTRHFQSFSFGVERVYIFFSLHMLIIFVRNHWYFSLTLRAKLYLTKWNEGGKVLAPNMWGKTKRMTLVRFEKQN